MRPNGYCGSRTFNGKKPFEFIAQYLAIGDEARIRDQLLGAQSHPRVDFPATGLMTSALPNALDTHIQDRSPQRFHALALARGTARPHTRPQV